MVKTALSRHFAAKQIPTQRFNSVMSSQLHVAYTRVFQLIYTTADQSGVSSHFGFAFFTQFIAVFFLFFTKLKWKNTLIFTMHYFVATLQILCWGKFKDFSRLYSGIQGLFKDFWQSRTYKGLL